MGYKDEFIEFMISADVLRFGDFTLKSGRQSPYFVNTGLYKTGAQIVKLGGFYAESIKASGEKFDFLFGPAYKGIPLCVSAASALYTKYGLDVPYSFNRKEAKDHGEGGIIVGHSPKDGERAVIVEDITTAGTSVRETIELFSKIGKIEICALYVSVDRMERGTSGLSALDEIRKQYGIKAYPIISVREIIAYLRRTERGNMADSMEAYLDEYGA